MITFGIVWVSVSVGFIGGFLFAHSGETVADSKVTVVHTSNVITLKRSEYRRVR